MLIKDEIDGKRDAMREGKEVGSVQLKVSYNPKSKLPSDQVNLLYQNS